VRIFGLWLLAVVLAAAMAIPAVAARGSIKGSQNSGAYSASSQSGRCPVKALPHQANSGDFSLQIESAPEAFFAGHVIPWRRTIARNRVRNLPFAITLPSPLVVLCCLRI
jgi:hypothetical protein